MSLLAPSDKWRIVVWPDQGQTHIEWPRDELEARTLFQALQDANVPGAIVRPSGTVAYLTNRVLNDADGTVAAVSAW